MKYYTIVFPGEFGQHVQETWSTEQILEAYWDYWCERMYKANKDPEVHTFQDCIDDWCTIHWAEETDEFGNKIKCYCYNCNKEERTESGLPITMTRMILCPTCGNKRCPKSTDHRNECTHSNEPNQSSLYGNRYMEERTLIGYTEREEGYYPLYEAGKGYIVTHAFILCKYCNSAISPNMGPRYDAVCISCYEKDLEERHRE